MKKLLLIIVMCISFFYSHSLAKTFNVNKTDMYFQTINSALSRANDGDIIIVGPGIFAESIEISNKNDIKIIGSGPNNTKIQSESTVDAVRISNSSNINITGFTIFSGGNSVYFNLGSGVIQNCFISASKNGVDVASASSNGAVTIKNCIINGCQSHGIYTRSVSTTVLNNTIVSNNRYGVMGDCFIKNNIIVFNGNKATSCTDKKYLSHNNLYNNRQNDPPDYVDLFLGEISADPLFIDTENFVLQAGSPCRDAGLMGPQYIDPDGTRNDMGAYGGPDAAIFWPYVSSGPIVTEIELTPSSVPKGTKIQLKARGVVR